MYFQKMHNPLGDEKSDNLKNMAFCKLHSGSRYCYLNLLQDQESFICSQCLFSLQDGYEKVDFSKKVDLIQAYQKPEVLLSKIIESKEKKNWIGSIFNQPDEEIVKQFDQQIHQLSQLINMIARWIQNLNDQRLQIIKARDNFSQIISDIIQFPKFKQFIIQLSNEQNSSLDAIRQIEKDVQQYLRELKKDYCRPLIQKLDESFAQYHIKFAKIPIYEVNQFKTEFDKFSVTYQNFQKSIQQTLTPMGNLLQPTFKQTLLNEISKNLNKEINYLFKIYSSNEDGLNFDAMWRKISEKQNLLFVFRSGYDGVFGAFTPCTWQNNGQHGFDQVGGSFLFSQNQQTIYRIKETHKKWAQYYNGNVLIFGGTWRFDEDINISKNFQDGFSKLGASYQAQNLDGTKPSEILFQGRNPNIKQLEIFQIK